MSLRLSCLIFWVIASLSAFPDAVRANQCDDPNPLRIAVIPKKSPEALASEYRPLLLHLEKALKRPVVLLPAASYGNVIEALVSGRADLAELGPAAYAIAKKRASDLVAFASFSKLSAPYTPSETFYQALLIVRQDSKFKQIDDLRGKRLSLTDPASTSGALIPAQIFAKTLGTPLPQYFQRVSFAGSHDRAIQAVQKGLVDAAFVSSSRLDEAVLKGSLSKGELRVLWESFPIPYDPFVLRGRLCSPLAEKIRTAFLENSPALDEMFNSLQIKGFTSVNDERYREIRLMYESQLGN